MSDRMNETETEYDEMQDAKIAEEMAAYGEYQQAEADKQNEAYENRVIAEALEQYEKEVAEWSTFRSETEKSGDGAAIDRLDEVVDNGMSNEEAMCYVTNGYEREV